MGTPSDASKSKSTSLRMFSTSMVLVRIAILSVECDHAADLGVYSVKSRMLVNTGNRGKVEKNWFLFGKDWVKNRELNENAKRDDAVESGQR